MKNFVNGIVVALVLLQYGCSNDYQGVGDDTFPVKITFAHRSGPELLQLGKEIINPHGEPLSITAFSYYLSHFALTDATGKKHVLPVEYFLIDEKAASTKSIIFQAPPGTYQSIEWLLGVDSARNVSGVQSGALDPANGMFWSWNTGYIFAKMEGKSSLSAAPLQNVTFHIGGFRQSESALQTVVLNFPSPLVVKEAGDARLEIAANTDAWFKGVHDIKIAETAFTMTPGLLAQRISANYARMFSVTSVNN
jgi:hypothetical protein